MTRETLLLLATALSLGFVHTLAGPDHYIPFMAMSKTRRWSLPKTLWITFFSCHARAPALAVCESYSQRQSLCGTVKRHPLFPVLGPRTIAC